MITVLLCLCIYIEEEVLIDLKSLPKVMELERVVDAYSDPIDIPGGLVFGHEIVNTAYVSVSHFSNVTIKQ